jgi:MFS family permease
MGSAGIEANGMAMVAEVFPDRDRGKALGFYMAIIGTGAVSGPLVGGLLVSQFGWRSVFFAGIPVGLLAVAAATLVLKGRTDQEATATSHGSFDWLGAAMSSSALVMLLLAMTNGWRLGWTSPLIVSGIAAAIALLIAFVWWELRAPAPILDMGLFGSRVFSMAIGARFLSFVAGSAVFFLMPFYLIQGLGYPASRAALLMVPGSIAMALLGPFAGRLSDRVGTRWPAAAGMALSTAAMFVFSTLSTDSSAYHVVLGMLLSGSGMAIFSSPNSSAILGTLPREKYGIVSAFVNLTRTSANVMGVAFATLIVTLTMSSLGYEPSLSAIGSGVDDGLREAFVQGMGRAYAISGGLMVLALVLTIGRGETVGAKRPAEPAASPSPGDD